MTENVNLDPQALGQVLSQAKVSLDQAVSQLRGSGALGAASAAERLRSVADNNSSCNTACSCGSPAELQAARVQPG